MRTLFVVGFLLALCACTVRADIRVAGDKCEGCTVEEGVGYNSFLEMPYMDCTCFFHCTIDHENGDFIGHKMCCPCGSAWSQKLSTCVRTKHPLSDCRFRKDETNPCNEAGNIPRNEPHSADALPMCTGYFECIQVPGSNPAEFVPMAKCCKDPTPYYDPDTKVCVATPDDDCSDDQILKEKCCFVEPEELPIECTLVPGPSPNTFYMSDMGDSNLFHCSEQMVFDEEKCACVRDKNFAWPECPPNFLQFSDPPLISRAVSSSGPSLWTIWNDVVFNGGQTISTDAGDVETGVNVAEFALDEDQYINLVFSAHGGFGRSGSLCFWSLLNGDNANNDLNNNEEALFTNCRPDAGANFSPDHVQDDSTLRISVERNADQEPVAVNVYVRLYSDSSRNPWNFEVKTLSCALSNTEVDEWFQVCLIWSGQYNAIRLVCKSNDDSMTEDSAETSGFGIVASKSGLIEGNDLTGANGLDPLFGKLALVEFYKGCLPEGLWK